MNRLKYLIGSLISLGLLGAALTFLYKVAHRYRYEDILAHVRELPGEQVLMAIGLAAASYAMLTFYDRLAVGYVGHTLPYRRIALASFIGYTFSNNLGFALLTGTSVRYRLYTLWGMNPSQIAQIVVFCSVTFFLGLFFVGGLCLLFAMPPLPPDLDVPNWVRVGMDWIGVIAVASGAGYLLLPLVWKKPLTIRGVTLPVPGMGLSAAQLLVAGLDWVAASAVFYAVLPPVEGLTFFNVLTIFMAGNILGVMAHVPGGIGVFESVATFLLAPWLSTPEILGSLVAYRAVYYILPFVLALLAFAGYELMQKLHWLRKVSPAVDEWAHGTMPAILSVSSFIAGAALLFSCITPTVDWRLEWLADTIPLFVLELAHLAAAAAAIGLLLTARGLLRRQRRAWRLVRRLLAAGIVFALVKGLDYEEATFMALTLVPLWVAKDDFIRRGSPWRVPLPAGWLVGIAAALAAGAWLGLVAYRPELMPASHWWKLEYGADAARAFRATIVVAALGLAFTVYRLQHRWRRRKAV